MDEDDERGGGGVGLSRTLALSDGIFAIAMTLVAFQIQVPDLHGNAVHHLTSELRSLSPSYFVFALTFFVIGAFWMSHHRLFRQLAGVDDRLMWLNLVFLATIAFLPFPSGVLGRYGSQSSAVVLYAVSMVAAGLLIGLLTLEADRRALLAPTLTRQGVRFGLWRSASLVIVFGASIPVALARPKVAPFTWLVLVPLRLLARRRRALS